MLIWCWIDVMVRGICLEPLDLPRIKTWNKTSQNEKGKRHKKQYREKWYHFFRRSGEIKIFYLANFNTHDSRHKIGDKNTDATWVDLILRSSLILNSLFFLHQCGNTPATHDANNAFIHHHAEIWFKALSLSTRNKKKTQFCHVET